jgi:hypothetical protein
VSRYLGAWIAVAVVMTGLILAISRAASGRWLGALVDSRNKMSLSQLQILLWTIVFVSAYFTIALTLRTMNVYVPEELWALLGISTGSAAGAVIIKGNKRAQEPATRLNLAPAAHMGLLSKADAPRFMDLFRGDEATNAGTVDISKVQMFFFTIAAVIGYVIALLDCNLSHSPADVTVKYGAYFPAFAAGLVTLIGISHTGYLTVKAAPRTPTQ